MGNEIRSPYTQTNDLCYFARMVDKIRLHAAGNLPADYHPNLGGGFDARCVSFLGLSYQALADRVKKGGTDTELLDWCHQQADFKPTTEQIEVWNEFMRKRGWNDDGSAKLKSRLEEGGFAHRTDIQTFFDYIDLDEGRR